MKVKLLTTRSTPEAANSPGDIIDVPADEAKRLLESNQAEPVARKRVEKAEKR